MDKNKIEKSVFELVDEISNELELDVKSYPEVLLAGKTNSFESMGLPESYKNDFENLKKTKTATFFPVHNVIITATDEIAYLAEEAGHFIHTNKSKINLIKPETENPIDCYAIKIIMESIGFFCSRLIDSKRENYFDYKNFRTFIFESLNKNKLEYKSLEACIVKNYDLKDDFFIYKNGYGLGEKLFDNYISGKISKSYIRSLIKRPFKENFSATKKMIYLLEKFNP